MLESLHAVTWREVGIHSGQVTSTGHKHSLAARDKIRASKRANAHVSELWEGTGQPEENPRRHWENMQTPHRDTCANLCSSMQLQDLLDTPAKIPCKPTQKKGLFLKQ